MSNMLLEMKGITKIYPGVIANDHVDFAVEEGEIHALIGENGAGKSTLMKILFGSAKPDEGTILLKGKELRLSSALAAIEHGIGMVHQHFMLAEGLTVTENIILGLEPTRLGVIKQKEARKSVEKAIEKYKFALDPNARVSELSIGAKQKVEILKSLVRGSKLLILDEPTAVLTPQETEELFTQLLKLKQDGYTIVFISHKLDEIKQICNRGTVMRRGKVTGSFDVESVTMEEISRLMIGRVVTSDDLVKPAPQKEPAVKLVVNGISAFSSIGKPLIKNVSFNVKSGQILGIAGVEGNGQAELIRIITGLRTDYEGDVLLNGQSLKNSSIAEIRDIGLGHIPEDRMTLGMAPHATIEENIISTTFRHKNLSGKVLINQKEIAKLSDELIKKFAIKTNSGKEDISNLSGGNIQKVVVAREMHTAPELLVADQPTRGIDVGASMYIRQKILDLKGEGSAIILLSADMDELFSISDSVAIMYSGEISAYFENMDEVNEEKLGWYMLGVQKMPAEEIKRRASL